MGHARFTLYIEEAYRNLVCHRNDSTAERAACLTTGAARMDFKCAYKSRVCGAGKYRDLSAGGPYHPKGTHRVAYLNPNRGESGDSGAYDAFCPLHAYASKLYARPRRRAKGKTCRTRHCRHFRHSWGSSTPHDMCLWGGTGLSQKSSGYFFPATHSAFIHAFEVHSRSSGCQTCRPPPAVPSLSMAHEVPISFLGVQSKKGVAHLLCISGNLHD